MTLAEKRAKLIANYAEKVVGECKNSGDKLDAIKGAIAELRAMHEEIQNEAAAAAVMLSSEYSERAE